MLNFSTFSVGGCWGHHMFFFENWWMKLKCPNLRNTQISSFWRKYIFSWLPRSSKYVKTYRKTLYAKICVSGNHASGNHVMRGLVVLPDHYEKCNAEINSNYEILWICSVQNVSWLTAFPRLTNNKVSTCYRC